MNIALMRGVLPLAAVALLMAACAQTTTWHRAGVEADEVAFDLQTCRGQVRAQMSTHQYFAHERAAEDARAADAAGRGDGTAAIRERWAEASGRRNTAELIAECMARKGYRRGPAPAPSKAA